MKIEHFGRFGLSWVPAFAGMTWGGSGALGFKPDSRETSPGMTPCCVEAPRIESPCTRDRSTHFFRCILAISGFPEMNDV